MTASKEKSDWLSHLLQWPYERVNTAALPRWKLCSRTGETSMTISKRFSNFNANFNIAYKENIIYLVFIYLYYS